jgi:uncharacterized protein
LRPLIATISTTELVRTCSPVCTSRGALSLFLRRWLPRLATCSARAGGAKIEAAFLRSIVQETLTIVDLELADYERMAELVEVYADFPLGTTDAAVVAVAERLGVSEIATLDRRHFYAVRPRHAGSFDLLP